MATTVTLRGQAIGLGVGSQSTPAFVATGGGVLVCFVGGYADEGTIPTAITVTGHGGTWVAGSTFTSNNTGGLQSFAQFFYNTTYTTASAAVNGDPNQGTPITTIWVAEVLADGALTFEAGGQANAAGTAAQATYADADNSAAVALYGIVYFVPQTTVAPINSATELLETADGAAVGEHSGGYRLTPGATKTYGGTLGVSVTRWHTHVIAFNEASSGPITGTATLTYGGTVTATGTKVAEGTAALAYGYQVDATGTIPTGTVNGTATLVYGGSVAATGTKVAEGTAALAYGYQVDATGTKVAEGTATLDYGGTLTATGTPTIEGTAALAYGYQVDATGTIPTGAVLGTATLAYGGTVTATGTKVAEGTAALAYGYQVDATGVIPTGAVLGTATLAYGGAVTATGTKVAEGTATASYGGTVTATGVIPTGAVLGTATLAYGGTVAATGLPVIAGTATLAYGYQVDATGTRVALGTATLTYGGTVTATGQLVIAGTVTLAYGYTVAAAVETLFEVIDGQIITAGAEFIAAGLNGGLPIRTGFAFGGAADTIIAWAYDGYPAFTFYTDVWPGDTNEVAGEEVFPGGLLNGGKYWDQTTFSFVTLTDRAYALTGIRTAAAISGGIEQPSDHWHCRIWRGITHLRDGPYTWDTGSTITSDITVPQYVARIRELVDLDADLVVALDWHDTTAVIGDPDFTVPAGLITDPTLDAETFADSELRDGLRLYDAAAAEFSGTTDPVWIGLPNEFNQTGRNTDYDDVIVTLIRRIRSAGYTGIITVPLPRWCGDLAALARGDLDTLSDRLESHGVGGGLVWEWHHYGKWYPTPGSSSTTVATWTEIDAALTACRTGVPGSGRKYAVWMAEYGQRTPAEIGEEERDGVDIMATNNQGEALATKHPHICPTWWTTADNTFDSSFALTYGAANKGNENGPDPNSTGTNPGTYPWWDITTTDLRDEWLTPGGLAHWNIAHAISPINTGHTITLQLRDTGHTTTIRDTGHTTTAREQGQ